MTIKTIKFTSMAALLLAFALLTRLQAAVGAPAATGVMVVVNSDVDAPLNPLAASQCQTAPANSTCTLRAAIMFANRNGGGAIILPALPGGAPYVLSIPPTGANDDASGDLNITQDLTLTGEGALSTIIDGGGLDRVFYIYPALNVIISGVTLRNGRADIAGQNGGGIYNSGKLWLNASVVGTDVAPNVANSGGGIANAGGWLFVNNSTVNGNSVIYGGGGIYNQGTLILVNSTVSRNGAGTDGGGVYSDGYLKVTNSTISGNLAASSGGGIYRQGATTALYNATIALNRAISGQGVYTVFGNGQLSMANSMVGENSDGSGGRQDCYGPVTSFGRNLVGVNACPGLGAAFSDVVGTPTNPVNLNIDYLLHNGGGTETHALINGLPLDRGDPDGCSEAYRTDQRGYFRPYRAVNTNCDVGAFEYEGVAGDVDGNRVLNDTDWTVTLGDWTRTPQSLGRWNGAGYSWDADASGRMTMSDLQRLRSCLDLRNINGLVSWWRAEGNSDDALCRNQGRRFYGVRTAPGRVGQAFTFDGVNDHLEVPDSATLEPAHVTLEAWVRRVGAPGGFVYIAAKGGDNNAASYALYTGADQGMYFYIYNPTTMEFAETPAVGTAHWDGNWHHIAGTYDGAAVRLYIDGVYVAGKAATMSIGYGIPVDKMTIGVYPLGFGWFAGNIDEIAVWSRALSATEVCQRALKPACP